MHFQRVLRLVGFVSVVSSVSFWVGWNCSQGYMNVSSRQTSQEHSPRRMDTPPKRNTEGPHADDTKSIERSREHSRREWLTERDKTKTYIILDFNGYIINELKDYFIGNCLVTRDVQRISQAHAIVTTFRFLRSIQALPKIRHAWQRWVWFLDECPHHAIDFQHFRLTDFNYVFNWTMTYRSDSDIYVPHGWTFRNSTAQPLPPNIGNRSGFIVAVMSNCGQFVNNHRMEYLRRLNRTVGVTMYGKCGKPCTGYSDSRIFAPCPELRNYLFYLAFENSNCREYITDKLFGNGFSMGAVPVVMGAPKEDYTKIAPPNSFIHTRDFASPEQLAIYLKHLSENTNEYMKFHEWRKYYATNHKYQYFTKSVWTPLCDKLNTDNGQTKYVPSLAEFWNVSKDCDDRTYW